MSAPHHRPRPARLRPSARHRGASTRRSAPILSQSAPDVARSLTGRCNKGPKDATGGLAHLEFRVPLDAEAEAVARIFDALDDAVFGDGVNDETRARRLDRLMMGAVHTKAVHFGDTVEQCARDNSDGVTGFIAWIGLAMRD